MKDYLKIYINKLFSYIPVAIFVFTLLILINISQTISDLKDEFGVLAIDEFISLYLLYFFRTIILALLIPVYDLIFSLKKLSYKLSTLIHGLLICTSVGILFYRPGIDILSMVISFGMSIIIYVIIWTIIQIREKQFIDNANKIFKQNKE